MYVFIYCFGLTCPCLHHHTKNMTVNINYLLITQHPICMQHLEYEYNQVSHVFLNSGKHQEFENEISQNIDFHLEFMDTISKFSPFLIEFIFLL